MVIKIKDELHPETVVWVNERTKGKQLCKHLAFKGFSAFGRIKWGHLNTLFEFILLLLTNGILDN